MQKKLLSVYIYLPLCVYKLDKTSVNTQQQQFENAISESAFVKKCLWWEKKLPF